MEGVKEINLKESSIADMIAIERDSFDEGNMCDICGLPVIGIATIAHCQSVIN